MTTKAKKTTKKSVENKEINFASGVFIKEITFDNGNTLMKINFDARKFCNWMKDNVNANGYVQTDVWSNKEGSKFTHSMTKNDYDPQAAAKAELQETVQNMPF